jgi:hypothetical protein
VDALGELFDHLSVKRGYVVRLTARDQAVVHNNLFVYPFRTGVDQVLLYRGGQGQAFDSSI